MLRKCKNFPCRYEGWKHGCVDLEPSHGSQRLTDITCFLRQWLGTLLSAPGAEAGVGFWQVQTLFFTLPVCGLHGRLTLMGTHSPHRLGDSGVICWFFSGWFLYSWKWQRVNFMAYFSGATRLAAESLCLSSHKNNAQGGGHRDQVRM